MSGLVSLAADLLILVAILCGLALLLLAVASVLFGVYRATRGGQVYVLPFRGTDERRSELMALFAQRLTELEQDWVDLASDIEDLRQDFADRTRKASQNPGERPDDVMDVAGGPRTTGEEVVRTFLDALSLQGDDHSLADVDTGVVTVAGVSFSPQQLLAFLSRIPAAFARRRLHGTISKSGNDYLVTVVFTQRGKKRKPAYTVSHVLSVADGQWRKGLDDAAFHLETKRLARLRKEKDTEEARKANEETEDKEEKRDAGDATPAVSQTVALAEVEAEDWEACEAFLMGHRAQLKHYQTGAAIDRDEALGHYKRALLIQPGYTRAAYNCATLLYNRYLPQANEEAIKHFLQATASQDPRVSALAHAGLAMAYCQAINRFEESKDILIPKAFRASQDALGLDPDLEEALFAVAWTSQVKQAWDRALREYDAVVALPTDSAAGNRIKSFALNNAGWIWLKKLKRRPKALAKAKAEFEKALGLYPNKVVHANLAEVARRSELYDDALEHFGQALQLDGEYVNARNERACLKIEMAAAARPGKARNELLADAEIDHARAVQLAEDDRYAAKLEAAFRSAIEQHQGPLGRKADALLGR